MTCAEFKSALLSHYLRRGFGTETLQWIGRLTDCQASGPDRFTVVLPVFRPNGDAIEAGIEAAAGGRWKLSDLGDTRAELFLAGVDLDDERHAAEFRRILAAGRVSDNQDELFVEASSDELVERMFELVHAVRAALQLAARAE